MKKLTYFTVAPKKGASTGAFSQFRLPQGKTARVLSESVFRKAVNAADKRLANPPSRKERATG
jgi:hypothetical protein